MNAPIPFPADLRRLCTTCGRVDRGRGCRCMGRAA